jgi:hypothetical protein
MFNFTAKESFWINAIFTAVFGFLLVRALMHIDIVGILLYGIFVYISGKTLKMHWERRMYPFDSGFIARVTGRAAPWRKQEGNGKRWN